MNNKIIKYPVIIYDKRYSIVIKEDYYANIFGNINCCYKVSLYKGKYNMFKNEEYSDEFYKKEYEYDLISMIEKFIKKYKEYYDENEKKKKAIEDLKKWDGSVD